MTKISVYRCMNSDCGFYEEKCKVLNRHGYGQGFRPFAIPCLQMFRNFVQATRFVINYAVGDQVKFFHCIERTGRIIEIIEVPHFKRVVFRIQYNIKSSKDPSWIDLGASDFYPLKPRKFCSICGEECHAQRDGRNYMNAIPKDKKAPHLYMHELCIIEKYPGEAVKTAQQKELGEVK